MNIEHRTSEIRRGSSRPIDQAAGATGPTVDVTLQLCPERRFIRPSGSFRHVDFQIRVGPAPTGAGADRMPLTLALVLDRSGSMQGEKLATAKRAALAVLDRLEARDRAAVVVFDNQVDVVQPVEPVTAAARARVRAALAAIGARASTALHEGWLTGCQSIAGDIAPDGGRSLARCFLLTDGLANVGVVDPELIAADAARIREHAGIGTSTFGIGADYDERLLGPMAVAGGGQFHHLRAASEIASTFVGELGGLLAVAASRVRLELEVEWGVTVDVVSAYWARTASPDEPAGAPGGRRWSIAIGDLLAGEERHVVVRFGFPGASGRYTHAVRARLAWSAAGIEWSTTWQEVGFSYADHGTCDAEVRDQAVMHWVGLHHADRARREAAEQSRRGDLREAREGLRKVASQIASYADSDSALQAALRELQAVEHEVAAAPVAAMVAKELAAESYRRSRGQRDLRSLRCSEE